MLTDEELDAIESRAAAATSGPWYAVHTDDERFMCARYVGRRPHPTSRPGAPRRAAFWRGLASGDAHQEPPENVVAITLLQQPSLCGADECDENTEFIAHARTDVPALVAEIRRLRDVLGQRGTGPES